jgi:cell division protein FtsL
MKIAPNLGMGFQTKLNIVISAAIIVLVAIVLYNFLKFADQDEVRFLDLKADIVANTRKITDLQTAVETLKSSVGVLETTNEQK